jgi:ketosteroid isomerase-like protein
MSLRTTLGLAAAAAALLCAPLSAQDFGPGATQVRHLEEKWTEAYKVRDIDILSSLLADDFVITVEDGNTYSKAGYIAHSADSSVHVEVATQSDMHVRVRTGGMIAVVTGAYYERGQSKGKTYEYHDRFTDVWVRSANGWRVLSSHYSIPQK